MLDAFKILLSIRNFLGLWGGDLLCDRMFTFELVVCDNADGSKVRIFFVIGKCALELCWIIKVKIKLTINEEHNVSYRLVYVNFFINAYVIELHRDLK